jgi:hypothetical protein
MALLSKDGIYISTGGAPVSMTDAELYPIFPNEGNIGTTTNGIKAPFIDSGKAANLRMTYYDEFLYFDYPQYYTGTPPTAATNNRTLAMSFDLGAMNRGEAPGGWFYDDYAPGVEFHYGEEGAGVHSMLCGALDGRLYQYTGENDDGSDIACAITPPYLDMGDARENKLFGDIMLDVNTDSVDITVTPMYNNGDISSSPTVANNATRGLVTIPCGDPWVTARNITAAFTFSVNGHNPELYIWEPRWTFEAAPIAALSWEISPSTFGLENYKSFGLCMITHVTTVNMELNFTIDNIPQAPITILSSGGVYRQDIFRVPVYKGKLVKMRLDSVDGTTNMRLDPRDSFFEVKQWGSDGPYNKFRIFGDFSSVEG